MKKETSKDKVKKQVKIKREKNTIYNCLYYTILYYYAYTTLYYIVLVVFPKKQETPN